MALEVCINEVNQFLKAAVSPIIEEKGSSGFSSAVTEVKALIASAAGGLVMETSKVAVLFGGTERPNDTEATAILHTFQQRFAALCAVVHSVVAGAGPTLRSAVTGAVNGLLCSCEAFLEDLKKEESDGQLPQRVGVIKERCEAVKRIPLNNAVALGRKLTLCARQIKDAHREAKELKEAESARGSAPQQDEQPVAEHAMGESLASRSGDWLISNDANTDGDGSPQAASSSATEVRITAVDTASGVGAADSAGTAIGRAREEEDSKSGVIEYETDELNPLEMDVAVAAEEVIKQVVDMLNTIIRILLRGAIPSGDDLESWESVAFHCKNLETTVNDLVAELYGPQDAEEVSSACHAVSTGKELILEDLPSSVLEQHGSGLADIDRRLTAAQDVLEQKVAQLLQEQHEQNLSSEE